MLTVTSPIFSEEDQVSKPPATEGPEGRGYSVWQFDGSQWNLKKDCSLEGAMVSPPPSVEGKFKGQLRSTASVAV